MDLELGQVIAERRLTGGVTPVTIKLGRPFRPRQFPNEAWCPFLIEGIGSGKVRRSIGADEMQALILALESIGSDLYGSSAYAAGKVKWFSENDTGDLGLPLPKNL